jgi:hypothetical protein
MRHDYDPQHVNGAFAGVVATALLTSVLGIAGILWAVFS